MTRPKQPFDPAPPFNAAFPTFWPTSAAAVAPAVAAALPISARHPTVSIASLVYSCDLAVDDPPTPMRRAIPERMSTATTSVRVVPR